MPRQPIGPPIQLPIAECLFFVHQRTRIRRPRCPLLEELVYATIPRILRCSVVPLHQQLVLFGCGKYPQLRKFGLGIRRHTLEQNLKVPHHAGDRALVE